MSAPDPDHSERVREIPEAAATGTVAAVYADIRRVLGVPFVALVYRVLACEPDRLEAIWADLGPNLGSDVAGRAAKRLVATPLSGIAVQLRGEDGVDLDAAAAMATLGAFRHTNTLNVIGLSALLEGVSAPRAPGPAPSTWRRDQTTLPMADLVALPRSTIALLEEMSAPIAGSERPIVIPSLFRHFAHDERLLALIWATIRPRVEGADFSNATAAIHGEARTIASSLPYRVARVEDEETRALVARFIGTISAMIVVGGLMEVAISGLKGRRDGGARD